MDHLMANEKDKKYATKCDKCKGEIPRRLQNNSNSGRIKHVTFNDDDLVQFMEIKHSNMEGEHGGAKAIKKPKETSGCMKRLKNLLNLLLFLGVSTCEIMMLMNILPGINSSILTSYPHPVHKRWVCRGIR